MINNDKGCINAECIETMRQGRTLDDLAGRLHFADIRLMRGKQCPGICSRDPFSRNKKTV